MRLVYVQLSKQIIKDRVFLGLLFFLAMLTSLCFFFGMFAIDGNMAALSGLESLTENQQLYKNALSSNTVLTYNFFGWSMVLTGLVFVMFFYRFFRANKKQIGIIKALGFPDRVLQIFFVVFTAALTFTAALVGMLGGYFLSDILLNANSQTYLVTGLTKSIEVYSLIIGLSVPTGVFSLVAFCCYGFVRNQEVGLLLVGNQQQSSFSRTLKIADKISRIMPVSKRFPLRIALRKPLAVLLLFVAVMSFNVCVILGQSLNISSAQVFASQTTGHNYEYDVKYSEYQNGAVSANDMPYLENPVRILIGDYQLERTITGLYYVNELYELGNQQAQALTIPQAKQAYINPELAEIYGVAIGDTLTVEIAGVAREFVVADIAANGKSRSVYVRGEELAKILSVPAGAYNGVLSQKQLSGDKITSQKQRIDELKRNSVSNQVSGVINQVIGVLVGGVLTFLALYLNFQDNTRDMIILKMMGYPVKSIRKMLVDIYLPILWTAFGITLLPSIILARTIQKSLAISTNDYMPFGLNILVILLAFGLISLIYWLVQITFSRGINQVTQERQIREIIH